MSSMIGSQGLRGATGSMTGNKLAGPYQGQKIGSGYKQGQLTNFTPEQMDLFQSLFSQVSPDSNTGRLANGDQSIFDQMEQPALKQFNELQGGLASRFSGSGGGNGPMSSRRSSGFQNVSNQAATDFASQLQGNRQNLQRQAIQDLMSMSQTLLNQKPYENFKIAPEQKKSFLDQIMGLFGNMAGGAASGFAGMGGRMLQNQF